MIKKELGMMLAAIVVLLAAAAAGADVLPSDYGKITMNSGTQKAGLAPVVFDHWLHRAKYTCRVCHVDIGFALKAGATGVTAADNSKGLYCGVCHNGIMQEGSRKVFQACTTDKADASRCERCHSQGKNPKRDYDFASFTAAFPKEKLGNGINWDKAATDGTIKPVDYIEGISFKRPAQPVEKDFTLHPKTAGKAEILFSHRKHVIWNGCEVCHPEIFKGGKRGSTVYSMKEINEGKFCGVCHLTVSFPVANCDRCHSQPVK